MLFMKFAAFGSCMGITYVDTTMIPVCNNVRRYFNKVFCSQTSPQQSRLKVQRLIHSFLAKETKPRLCSRSFLPFFDGNPLSSPYPEPHLDRVTL